MESPSFVIRVADLDRGPKKVTFTLSESWLKEALSDAHAVPLGPGSVSLELQKTGETVMVRGSAAASVTVPCVVTLDPVPFELKPEIFLQLAREAEPPAPSASKAGTAKPKVPAKEKPAWKTKRRLKDDPELSPEEAAYDTYRGEEIVFDGFLREFILLEIPPYPRRSDLPSSEESLSSRPLEGPPAEAKPIDPRLLPLLGLANRLRGAANKE